MTDVYAARRSRRVEVLDYMRRSGGRWVDTAEVSNERVGGSEGVRRLRELRAMGYAIEERRHPDPRRTSWQYRLVPDLEPVDPIQPSLWEHPR